MGLHDGRYSRYMEGGRDRPMSPLLLYLAVCLLIGFPVFVVLAAFLDWIER